MTDKGIAHIGIGKAKGDDKAIEAVKQAVASPLLETTITGASHVIINISGDITLMDANDAASYVQDLAGDTANIIFGAMYDDTYTDEASITVIATGLDTNVAGNTPGKIMPSFSYPTGVTSNTNATRPVTSEIKLSGTPGVAPRPLTGIQKPRTPESSVEEKSIKIPEFLQKNRK
jgi:cell division protein FtsZ